MMSRSTTKLTSKKEAARTARVHERTLHRWLKDPDFDAAYRQARRTVFSQSMARLQQMSNSAVTTLGIVMLDSNAPPASRLRAADAILTHAGKSVEQEHLEDLHGRITEVERRVAQRRK